VRRRGMALLAAGLILGPLTPVPAAASPALPNSMAALGDSITRAYDTCCFYGDHPGQSWSTGGAWYDGISSHYERIKRRNSAISGHAHNDAVTGAKMSAAAIQAGAAAAQQAAYVTILLGANDLCTSSPATMTSTDSFTAQFKLAMLTLKQRLPNARIFVSSIPDIYQLWKVLHTNSVARRVWATAGICPSMLGAGRTEAERQQVVAREVAFNQVLADACNQYGPNCRWDGGATYNYKFSASQVSALDFFHPDLDGQAALAGLTWAASWWPTAQHAGS
jgi:lysophospholipase L1-like esterase